MTYDCDVVVVGLGPVGDVVAGLLALEGLKVVGIERDEVPYPLPRAAVFDDEIMRIFQRLGVAERLESLCRVPDKYEFVSADDEVLLEFPVKGVPTVSGWEGSYVLHQPAVEGVLRDRLLDLAVDVRLGHRFVGVDQGADQALVHIEGPQGSYDLRARYVVGCDGAWSPVRQAVNIELFDYEFNEPWLVLDAVAPGGSALPNRLMQICDPARPATYLKMTGDRYRWEFMVMPGETPAQALEEGFIRTLLSDWEIGDNLSIERKAVYQFHGLVAKQWRSARVLLAGDAAHQMPPFAGQGMCAGIRDAGNLAWKLGSVIRGEASEGLLDSYQAEREPHVRAVIETAIAMGRIICLTDPQAAAGRNAEMLARRASGAQEVSMQFPDLCNGCLDTSRGAGALFPQPNVDGRRLDDVLGSGHWLVGHSLPELHLPAGVLAFDLSDPALAPYAPALNAWLVAHEAAAVLVRPDHHVFGSGDPTELIACLDRAGGANRRLAA